MVQSKNLLPNWSWVKLGDMIEKIPTTGIKLKQKEYLVEGKYPVVDQGQELVGGYSNNASLIVKTDLPIIIFGDHTKVKKFIDFKFIAGADGVIVIKPKKEFFPKLFFYFLHCIQFPDKGYARHFQYVEKETIPLPPLPEQKKIVEKIEELLSRLDSGVASLKKAIEQIRLYRQSVLASAFAGRLLGKDDIFQKENSDAKDVIFSGKAAEPHQDYQDSKISRIKEKNKSGKSLNPENPQILVNHGSDNLPEGWKWVKLGDVSNKIQYGFTESASSEPIGPKFLRITDIQKGNVIWEEVPYCKISDELKNKYLLSAGDIVFARTGATVGKSFLIIGKIPESIFASYLIRIQLSDTVSKKFIYYFFQSNNYWRQITEGQVGIGQPNVNGTKLSQLIVPLCSIEEQIQIVEEIEKRFSEADNLEKAIDDSLVKSETLRQSILKKAFEGKLV